ncbi:helix-turn-helix domain-containing protein [Streptococcus parauberis]|uniref:helix-turn-helix domain-containing protein n=1 Tax=Streptococcus parauberis TaxID=1348 RepID=UPI000CCEFAB3|nr:helix-turn-helix transcriptional regulator [Streptococcus parauberis]PNY18728.1 transcriptional repressor DicA [Streptococcus parauberis]
MKVEINKKALGQRIKSIRQKKGLTLEEFGKLFGAEKGIVSRWENGKTIPNADRLKTISIIGDYNMNELLYGDILTFVTEYLEDYLPEEKKYLRNEIPAYEVGFLRDKIKEQNISYTDIEKLNVLLDELIQNTEILFLKTISKYKNYLLENEEVLEKAFNQCASDYEPLKQRYKNLTAFKEDLMKEDPSYLSEVFNFIESVYIEAEMIFNEKLHFVEENIYLIEEEKFRQTFDITEASKMPNKIKLTKTKDSIENYDKVIAIYDKLFQRTYIIAWYDNKKFPLTDREKYLIYWPSDSLNISTFHEFSGNPAFNLGDNHIVSLSKVSFYAPILAIFY